MSASDNQPTRFDPRKADMDYVGFPSFAEWANLYIDTKRWDSYAANLRRYRQESPELFKKALRIVSRAASVDTGAIENLYQTDRGFTFTVAMEVAAWESAVAAKGAQVRPLLEAQFKAYDYVLNLATQRTPIAEDQRRPITEALIRELHEVICEGQDEYQVWTEVGPQKHRLPKGKYKVHPNHVRLQDGGIHAYAPVDMTADEMYRFCQELQKEEFNKAHPALQAAYAHYAFVAIHPFADGNGRVARALASVFTLRAESIPVLILADTRPQYFDALHAADQKSYQPFVDFMFDRSREAIELVIDSFEAAKRPTPKEALAGFERVYVTKGGYSHEDVNKAGMSFYELFWSEIGLKTIELTTTKLKWTISTHRSDYNFLPPFTKHVGVDPNGLLIELESLTPAGGKVTHEYVVGIPIDPDADDSVILHGPRSYSARIRDLIPAPSAAIRLRVSIMVDGLLSQMLQELTQKANEALRQSGYK